MNKKMLTTKQVSEKYGLAQGTLRNWRHEGKGPAYHRIEGKITLYEESDAEEFFKAGKIEPGDRAERKPRKRHEIEWDFVATPELRPGFEEQDFERLYCQSKGVENNLGGLPASIIKAEFKRLYCKSKNK